MMEELKKLHSQYLNHFVASSKLDANPYSIVPTLTFMCCTFVLLYYHFHRFTFTSTRWKTRLYKDAVFHWIYFYIVRIWFLFMKFGRYMLAVLDNYIEMTSPKHEVIANQIINHALIFMFTLTLSTLPFFILCVSQVSRRNIPNFLMWVAEDPWIGSEIGTSGHYLQRPARIAVPYKYKNSAFRSRRSTSVDTNIFDQKEATAFRSCKSMVTLNVVKGVNDLAE